MIEKLPFLCDYILRNGAEVGQTKREILAHIGSVDEIIIQELPEIKTQSILSYLPLFCIK